MNHVTELFFSIKELCRRLSLSVLLLAPVLLFDPCSDSSSLSLLSSGVLTSSHAVPPCLGRRSPRTVSRGEGDGRGPRQRSAGEADAARPSSMGMGKGRRGGATGEGSRRSGRGRGAVEWLGAAEDSRGRSQCR
jgi:hypothetical protein